MKRIMGPLLLFLVKNGILTVATTMLIMTAMILMLNLTHIGPLEALPAFLLILAVTTLFFFIIFTQGRKLRGEQERLLTVFEHITDGVLILDKDMNIMQSNPAARRLLDLKPDQSKLNFCKICTDESGIGRLCDYDACFLHGPTGFPKEVAVHTRQGELRSVSMASSTYTDPNGRLWHIFRIGELEKERIEERNRIAKMLTHSILQAQEQERKRISRELHDGIGQSLYSALLQLDVISTMLEGEEDDDPARERIEGLQQALRQTIEDIRHLSAELRPSVLDDMGLLAALRNHIQSFGQKFGLQVNFTYEGDKSRLPPQYETALYRIAQEALTNAAKYSHAVRIDVTLYQNGSEAGLTVKDYGDGFSLSSLERKGVGLFSMEERTEVLGGMFRIDSQKGKGTTVSVKLPLQAQKEQVLQ